jgi:hypothetical protein
LLCALAGCGGGSEPAAPTGPRTETFTGTTQIVSGVCTGTTHAFDTGEGSLTVTLVQSTGNVPLSAQVCHPTAVNHAQECTIPPFATVEVGASVSAALKGGRAQVLVMYPLGCAGQSTPPISYTVTVVHPG